MPSEVPWIKPKNDNAAPAAANSAAHSSFRSIINAAMAPRINPASTAPPPNNAMP